MTTPYRTLAPPAPFADARPWWRRERCRLAWHEWRVAALCRDEPTLEQVGDAIGLSRERVRQICETALAALRRDATITEVFVALRGPMHTGRTFRGRSRRIATHAV